MVYDVEETLSQLHTLDNRLSTTIAFLDESARSLQSESNRRITQQEPRRLEGLPFTVKDVIDVSGARTTGGSRTRINTQPVELSAKSIERLVSEGAIPVAKDSTTEFAVGGMDSPLKGPCRNPWDRSRWTGGSSSGTAASVASGIVPFGIGTDVNGSVRMPSAFCGVTALKPTHGLVSMHGVIPMAPSTEVVGPIAKNAKILTEVFSVLAGTSTENNNPRVRRSSVGTKPDGLLDNIRLTVPRDPLFLDCDSSVLSGLEDFLSTLKSLQVSVVDSELPSAAYAAQAAQAIIAPEAAAFHCDVSDLWKKYGNFTQQRLSLGLTTSATEYIRAKQFSLRLEKDLRHLLNDSDAIVLPTVPASAPRISDSLMSINGHDVDTFSHQSRFVSICSITGFPAISFPTGFDASGCPISSMLISTPGTESLLLSLVETYQARSKHHLQVPHWT